MTNLIEQRESRKLYITTRGRYYSASARCWECMLSSPARSAIVRQLQYAVVGSGVAEGDHGVVCVRFSGCSERVTASMSGVDQGRVQGCDICLEGVDGDRLQELFAGQPGVEFGYRWRYGIRSASLRARGGWPVTAESVGRGDDCDGVGGGALGCVSGGSLRAVGLAFCCQDVPFHRRGSSPRGILCDFPCQDTVESLKRGIFLEDVFCPES